MEERKDKNMGATHSNCDAMSVTPSVEIPDSDIKQMPSATPATLDEKIDALIDGVTSLTRNIGELNKSFNKKTNAGRF